MKWRGVQNFAINEITVGRVNYMHNSAKDIKSTGNRTNGWPKSQALGSII